MKDVRSTPVLMYENTCVFDTARERLCLRITSLMRTIRLGAMLLNAIHAIFRTVSSTIYV